MLKRIILVGVAFGIFLPQVHAKNYYKWVDSKGNVTYSSKRPPAGTKQQKIETLRSLGSTPDESTQRKEFKSNASIPTQYINPYQNSNRTAYTVPRQPVRSAEDEALRQKIIKEASTPYAGAKGLTANQRRTLAAMNGVDVPADNSNSRNSYSVPMPPPTPSPVAPTHMTSCDGSGCWDNQGNRYNGNNGTYFNNGRVCRDIGGQMQCN